MRISLARCAFVVLAILVLSGCTSSGSKWYAPSWSFPSLNPIKSWKGWSGKSSVPKPSQLASPNVSLPPAPGYAAVSSGPISSDSGYPNTPASYGSLPGYQGTQYASTGQGTAVGYGIPSSSTASGSSRVTPQDGYYDPGAAYSATARADSQASGSSYDAYFNRPSGSGSRNYDSSRTSDDRYANRDYSAATASGSYGSRAIRSEGHGDAPSNGRGSRYGVAADRYGIEGAGSRVPLPSEGHADGPPNGQTAPSTTTDSRYNSGTAPYRSAADTPSYGGTSDRSAYSGGLDSRQGTNLAGGYGAEASDYRNTNRTDSRYGGSDSSNSSQYGSASGNDYRAPWNSRSGSGTDSASHDRYANAGGVFSESNSSYLPERGTYNSGGADYKRDTYGTPPGQTGYTPGRTGYEPGQTGYEPPNTPPYQPPSGYYAPPNGAASNDPSYSPGSISRYTPRNRNLPDSSDSAPASSSPYPSYPSRDSSSYPSTNPSGSYSLPAAG